ncbi:MAG: hypothetical protein ACYDHY_00745 [Acidiferrobacterales bacterium]
MTLHEIDILTELDPEWMGHVRKRWLRLMEIAVWGDLRSRSPGSVGKVRRRTLEMGEKWRSVFNDRAWIPQVRQRAKNFLGSVLSLRDSLLSLEKAAKDLEGGADYAEFAQILAEMGQAVTGPLAERENKLAVALERLSQVTQDEEGVD